MSEAKSPRPDSRNSREVSVMLPSAMSHESEKEETPPLLGTIETNHALAGNPASQQDDGEFCFRGERRTTASYGYDDQP